MEKRDERSFALTDGTHRISKENHIVFRGNRYECDPATTFESDANANDKKVETKEPRLLSSVGWKNYQTELIQLCFKCWEVNNASTRPSEEDASEPETDGDVDTRMPPPLFADDRDAIRPTARNDVDNIRFFETVNDPGDAQKTDGTGLETVSVDEGARIENKKIKRFSFYTHTSKYRMKPFSIRNGSVTRCARGDSPKREKRSNFVEKAPKRHESSVDDEPKRVEWKTRQSIGHTGQRNGMRNTVGSPNGLKRFLKNAFRPNQSELFAQQTPEHGRRKTAENGLWNFSGKM